jgi:cyclophilin family peptidyl-prolyl cis-trans isomerase
MNRLRLIPAALLLLFFLGSCSEKEYIVTFHTDYGDMQAILYDETPKHKENFIKLTEEGYYDSLLFHRVIQNFMIQGGDPDSRNAEPGVPLGQGGPGYQIDAEFVPRYHHKKGALSAARQGDNINPQKKSSGSQFYIVQGQVYDKDEITIDMQKLSQMCQRAMQLDDSLAQYFASIYQEGGNTAYAAAMIEMKDSLKAITNMDYRRPMDPEQISDYTTIGGTPHLDDQYTVFGEVINGLEVIDKIAALPTDQRDRPMDDVRFTVTIKEMSKSKITKEYGYEFPASE